jgi:hypothetical protein
MKEFRDRRVAQDSLAKGSPHVGVDALRARRYDVRVHPVLPQPERLLSLQIPSSILQKMMKFNQVKIGQNGKNGCHRKHRNSR